MALGDGHDRLFNTLKPSGRGADDDTKKESRVFNDPTLLLLEMNFWN
jgi:hypothetical protein